MYVWCVKRNDILILSCPVWDIKHIAWLHKHPSKILPCLSMAKDGSSLKSHEHCYLANVDWKKPYLLHSHISLLNKYMQNSVATVMEKSWNFWDFEIFWNFWKIHGIFTKIKKGLIKWYSHVKIMKFCCEDFVATLQKSVKNPNNNPNSHLYFSETDHVWDLHLWCVTRFLLPL